MHLHTKNEVCRSRLSKVRARAGQTTRRDWYQLSCKQNSVTDKKFYYTTVIQRHVLICHIIFKHRLSFVVEHMLSFRFPISLFLLAMQPVCIIVCCGVSYNLINEYEWMNYCAELQSRRSCICSLNVWIFMRNGTAAAIHIAVFEPSNKIDW